MRVLDKTGLTTLWSKIKDLTSKYLPLTGGTITGNLTLNGTVNTSGVIINSNNSKQVVDLKTFSQINNSNDAYYIQGCTNFNNYLFQAYIGCKYIEVIDLNTYNKIAIIDISQSDSNSFLKYHGNTISFGSIIPDGSNFPYLYYACEYNKKPCIKVIKILNNSTSNWSGEIVQTIFLPVCNGGQSQDPNSNIAENTNFSHYYQNGCVDIKHNSIWVCGYTKESYTSNINDYEGNVLVYREYELPDVNSGQEIYLSHEDVKKTFTKPFIPGTQGMYIAGQYLFQITGYIPKQEFSNYISKINLEDTNFSSKTYILSVDQGIEFEGAFLYNENIYTIYTKNNWRYYVLSKLMQSEGDYAFDIDKAIKLGLLVKNDSLIL